MVEKFGGPYGYSLNARKSICDLLGKDSLVVDAKLSIEEVATIAMNRTTEQLYDAIVVTKKDHFLGIVTLRDLILTFISTQIQRAEEENPLTRLPGNRVIQQKISNIIKEDKPFSIMYLDMDNFKAYNGAYGFGNGDKMICQMAKSIKKESKKNVFIGHVGGDDFVIILNNWEAKKVHLKVIQDFEENIIMLYHKEDWERGYIIAKGRDGKEQKYGIVTISTAVITNKNRKIKDEVELSLQIAKLKKRSKQIEENSLIII